MAPEVAGPSAKCRVLAVVWLGWLAPVAAALVAGPALAWLKSAAQAVAEADLDNDGQVGGGDGGGRAEAGLEQPAAANRCGHQILEQRLGIRVPVATHEGPPLTS